MKRALAEEMRWIIGGPMFGPEDRASFAIPPGEPFDIEPQLRGALAQVEKAVDQSLRGIVAADLELTAGEGQRLEKLPETSKEAKRVARALARMRKDALAIKQSISRLDDALTSREKERNGVLDAGVPGLFLPTR